MGHPTSRPPSVRRGSIVAAMLVIVAACGLMLVAGVGPFAQGPNTATAHVAGETPVTATDLIGRVANNSPALATDPTNARFMVMATRTDAPFDCAMQVSGNGGAGWLTIRPVTRLPAGALTCYGPEVAFDAHGVLYFLFVGLGPGNSPIGAYLTTSSDHAQHFSAPHQVLGAERYQVRLAIDRAMGAYGRLHLVWLEARSPTTSGGLGPGSNPIMAKHSGDGGYTFSPATQISDATRARVVAPAVALGPDHVVQVAYYDLGADARDYEGLEGPTWTGQWSLVMTTSTDGGVHFGRGSIVDTHIVPTQRVMLIYTMPPASVAVDPSSRVFVAWSDARNGDWDVFLRRSADDGQTWGSLVRLNDDALHDNRNQYMPQLSVAPSGRVDAVFYDRRSNVENQGNDVSYTFSRDGGRTFSRNVSINSLTFDSFIGPRYLVPSAKGLREFGSRIALASNDSGAVAAWTDTRHTFITGKAQDIFAARVTVDEPWWQPWAFAGGAALLAVAVGGALWAGRRILVERLRRCRATTALRSRAAMGIQHRRRALLAAGLALTVGVIATGVVMSGGTTAHSRAPLPPAPPTVLVTMREYRFDFNAASIHRGRVIFKVVNDGKLVHRLVLIPLPEGFPPIEEQLRGTERRSVQEAVAIRNLEPPGKGQQHGMTESFAFDLQPGRYAFVSLYIDPDGVSQALKGMANEFRVR
jgi:hypothetical protein